MPICSTVHRILWIWVTAKQHVWIQNCMPATGVCYHCGQQYMTHRYGLSISLSITFDRLCYSKLHAPATDVRRHSWDTTREMVWEHCWLHFVSLSICVSCLDDTIWVLFMDANIDSSLDSSLLSEFSLVVPSQQSENNRQCEIMRDMYNNSVCCI